MAKEPKLGNIRSGGQIVGYRDWISKEFVPIVEGWALVSDNACENNNLLISSVDNTALVGNNGFLFGGTNVI